MRPLHITRVQEERIFDFPGAIYICNFNISSYTDSTRQDLFYKEFDQYLDKAAIKRKAEFWAGRFLAREALTKLKSHTVTVAIGKNGEPLWPDFFIGSITHSNEFAICAAAKKKNLNRVGVDTEHYIDIHKTNIIAKSVLLESEHKFLNLKHKSISTILTLIFSAKESLFKALFPEVGNYFGFDSAQTKEINFQEGIIVLELKVCLTPNLKKGTCFNVFFKLDSKKVITLFYS